MADKSFRLQFAPPGKPKKEKLARWEKDPRTPLDHVRVRAKQSGAEATCAGCHRFIPVADPSIVKAGACADHLGEDQSAHGVCLNWQPTSP